MNMNPVAAIMNAARRLESLFPGFYQPSTKHDHFKDFGYPSEVTFDHLYRMFLRNGIARAGVEKTVGKTWQDFPFLLDHERDGSEGKKKVETVLEREIRQRFDDLRLWQHLAEADRRSCVGRYSGVILRLADSKRFQEPVDTVPGGLMGLVELIPAWEGQLTVSDWDTDEDSATYGQPKMFAFNEAQVAQDAGSTTNKTRTFELHPDRVLIWSRDGTVHGTSLLEPGYNDLIDLEKIKGAGGEGFWKNAKSAPVFEIDKEAKLVEMAKAMGVAPDELADKMNEQVEDWQKGFDQLLMIQGMQAKTLGITLPSPEHFWAAPLQSFAASISTPLKVLVGSQTGERASTEDAKEHNQTIMSRRNSQGIPNIMALVRRLENFSILPDKDWFIDWTDLTESSMGEKIDRANKMADTNQKMKDSGEIVFTHEEIRAAVDLEPLSPSEAMIDDTTSEEDETAALGLPKPGNAPSGK